MKDSERERWEQGERTGNRWRYAPKLLVKSVPRPFTAFETLVYRLWTRLAPGRQGGGLGAGSIPPPYLWDLLDREGITDEPMREAIERVLYRMDAAAKKAAEQLDKSNKS